ncbi:hypothetical protein [Rhizobium sp. SGZ-381]|uniref:hypothetical protein n=1 Tax=Rhizobium sp. SGZ-381 TaxID=3342800 RepID=UPI0036725474
MTAPAPFFLVTDNAREAALTLFAREPALLPAFVTLVCDPAGIEAIPTGARAIAYWAHARGLLAELWREQRSRLRVSEGWQIFDEITAWRAAIWRDDAPAAVPSAPLTPAHSAPSPTPAARQTRWH